MQHTYIVLEPAAHLDPGPEGHNVYGKPEHAMAKVMVPLDIQDTLLRLSGGRNAEGSNQAKMALLHSRSLLTRYLLGITGAQFGVYHNLRCNNLPTFLCVFMHSYSIYSSSGSSIITWQPLHSHKSSTLTSFPPTYCDSCLWHSHQEDQCCWSCKEGACLTGYARARRHPVAFWQYQVCIHRIVYRYDI